MLTKFDKKKSYKLTKFYIIIHEVVMEMFSNMNVLTQIVLLSNDTFQDFYHDSYLKFLKDDV